MRWHKHPLPRYTSKHATPRRTPPAPCAEPHSVPSPRPVARSPHASGCPRVSRHLSATLGGPGNRAQNTRTASTPRGGRSWRRKRPRLPPPPGCLTPLALTFPSRSCYPSTGVKETQVGLEDGGAAGAQVWASFGGRGPWGHPLRARRRPAPRCQRWELTSCPPPVRPIPFRSHKFMLPHLVLELF